MRALRSQECGRNLKGHHACKGANQACKNSLDRSLPMCHASFLVSMLRRHSPNASYFCVFSSLSGASSSAGTGGGGGGGLLGGPPGGGFFGGHVPMIFSLVGEVFFCFGVLWFILRLRSNKFAGVRLLPLLLNLKNMDYQTSTLDESPSQSPQEARNYD